MSSTVVIPGTPGLAPHVSSGAPASTRPRARERLVELGVALVVVACPLVFVPMSATPFIEPKELVVLAGCVAIWLGRPTMDRRVALAAGVWVAVLAVAGWFGVDRWFSVIGPDNVGNGLLVLGPCAFLLAVGTGLPTALVERIPRWLVATAVPVSALAVVDRFWPNATRVMSATLPFDGATLGNTVFLAGLTAVAAVAATRVVGGRRSWWWLGAVVLIASALSISTKRVGLIAVAVGLAIEWIRSRGDRRVRLVTVAVVATIVAWFALSPLMPSAEPVSGVARFDQLTTDSARARVLLTGVLLRASTERPWLGWGPGNTWSAYLSNASQDDVRLAERGVADAHDLLVGALVTSGAVGLVAFLALLGVVIARIRRAPRAGWAAAVAASLFVFHLMQPVGPALTPLLFLVAGIAVAPGAEREPAPSPAPSLARPVVGLALGAGLLLALLQTSSSVLEQVGRTYNSTWALRQAVALAPGRVWPVRQLALYEAEDAAAHVPGAADTTRALVERVVARHPWYPDVRFVGLDAGLVMNDDAFARRWLREQLAVFPADREWLPASAIAFAEGAPAPGGAALLSGAGEGVQAADGGAETQGEPT